MALTRIGSVGLATGIDINAGVGTFTGNLTVGGVLTYEDVTNVDSIGIITARSNILVGSGITLSPDGDVFATGITTVGGDFSIADKIIHTGDTTTAIRFPAVGTISFECAGEEILKIGASTTELLRISGPIDASTQQEFGIGIAVNDEHTHPAAQITFKEYDASDSMGDLLFYTRGTNSDSAPTERLRINYDGRVLINSSTSRNIGANISRMLQIESSGGGAGIAVVRNSDNTSGPILDLGKSRGYPNTIVQSGDKLGVINFAGADGTNLETVGAQITGEVDGTPGENDMPGRIVFKTTPDGSSSSTERFRITSNGKILIGSDTIRNISGASALGQFQIEGTTGNTSSVSLINNQNNANGIAVLRFAKTRGTSDGAVTTVADGDSLGAINFNGADGTDLENNTAQIRAIVNGTVAGNTIPTDILFETSATDGSSLSEKVRIASDGDITISPDGDPIVTITGSGHPQVNLTSTSGTDHCSVNFGDSDDNNAGMIQYTNSTNIMQFHANGEEKARLLDTGRFLVGTQTSSQQCADGYIQAPVAGTSLGAWGSHAGSTGNRKHMRFSNPNGVVGSINTQSSGTSFNTSSDYRLKENQSAISNAISRINQLKPYTFNFKANPSEKIDGFFAHEAQELIPYAVSGEKDGEEMQSMDYGKLTPLLTAALQEAVAKIEVLEAEVAALKS